MLDDRKSLVLSSIVQSYLATAVPVGSRLIARHFFKDRISSATLRNEMADLEEEGYLFQPHTSAGRIPSDKGYRYFVDYLMALRNLTESERGLVSETIDSVEKQRTEIKRLFGQVGSIITQMTNYPSYVLTPAKGFMRFQNVQLIKMDSSHALGIFVGDSRVLEEQIIRLDEDVDQDRLHDLSRIVNLHFSGATIAELGESLIADLSAEWSNFIEYRSLLERLREAIDNILGDESVEVLTEGIGRVVSGPEFRSMDNLGRLVDLFEKKYILKKILSMSCASRDLEVRIGVENQDANLCEMAVITAPYSIDGNVVGAIGIIGPKRMDYPGVISTLKEISERLSKKFSSLI